MGGVGGAEDRLDMSVWTSSIIIIKYKTMTSYGNGRHTIIHSTYMWLY